RRSATSGGGGGPSSACWCWPWRAGGSGVPASPARPGRAQPPAGPAIPLPRPPATAQPPDAVASSEKRRKKDSTPAVFGAPIPLVGGGRDPQQSAKAGEAPPATQIGHLPWVHLSEKDCAIRARNPH